MSYLSHVRRLWLFLPVSLLIHGGLAATAIYGAARGSSRAFPTSTASALRSDTETELPLAEANGDSEGGEAEPPARTSEPPAPPASPASPPSPSHEPGTAVSPAAAAAAQASRHGAARPAPGGSEGVTRSGLIGAVGEPGAVELETAFLRALPQVASFDKDWNREPIGTSFTAIITVDVDDGGHLGQLTGVSGSTPLNRAIERSMGQLKPRLLTAHAPRTRISVTCTVHADEVHDGWHGDVFALGATASARGGTGFVALATGRRVDFVVTAR